MKRLFAAAALALMLSLLVSGCAKGLKESDVSYAGAMLDQVLAGIKDRDYAEFSKDFGPDMLSALPEDKFGALADNLESKIGDYQSRSFVSATDLQSNGKNYTKVVYRAKYTGETGDVLITITFGGEEGAKTVEGFFMSSPNLAK
jgi:hypothetical protein